MTNTEPEKSSAQRAAERITRNYDAPAIHKDFFAKKYTAIIEEETAAECAAWEQEKVELLGKIEIYNEQDTVMASSLEGALNREEAWEQREKQLVEEIEAWANAYPIAVFPEPDLVLAQAGLKSVGITLDAVSASVMRFAVARVKEIIAGAATPPTGDTP